MFKDSFNCLNDVHKRCILNSIEFCTHLEILKKNFQGCLSVQLSKFIIKKRLLLICWQPAFLADSYDRITFCLMFVNKFFKLFNFSFYIVGIVLMCTHIVSDAFNI